ncbi:MAG TPA: peptidylprolyl isomerase [Planctomycetota bacterium]|nr:peptidylprolyl isomerase [Planctomycetota bacterium]
MKTALAAIAVLAVGCSSSSSSTKPSTSTSTAPETRTLVRIKTTEGDMVIRLLPDLAPKTVDSFRSLVNKGFYDGLVFHRVIKGFMIQGGDPEGTGRGGPGYTVKAEFSSHPHKRGTVSMARKGDDVNSAGSQFFICHADSPFLDGQYTVFGELVSGFEVLDKIATAPVSEDRPLNPVKMERVTLEEGK